MRCANLSSGCFGLSWSNKLAFKKLLCAGFGGWGLLKGAPVIRPVIADIAAFSVRLL
jgi:hypothetical protein